jgi:hydrogenase maturation factor
VNGERCITCGDVAIEMTVVAAAAGDLAVCAEDGGRRQTVDLALVDDPRPGDRVLVHAGVALGRVDRVVP